MQLTVSTQPSGLSVEGLYTVEIADSKGNKKQAFEVSGKHNKITLNPVGIGDGEISITIKSPEGEILNKTEFNFTINMENKKLSDEILDRSGMSLMVGSDFNSITTITIDNSITDMNTLSILTNLKNFTIPLLKYRPIEEAIITSGGVDVKDISPKDMQSKLVSNLYFAGEIIDVDAYTGGFNLQIAFSTGYLAGKSAAENI